MKKIIVTISTLLLLMISAPVYMNAATVIATSDSANVATKLTPAAESSMLIGRLNEIKAMDRSTMSASEKLELRKEVKSIKYKLKHENGGIYLSLGAIVIIILLLIIFLK